MLKQPLYFNALKALYLKEGMWIDMILHDMTHFILWSVFQTGPNYFATLIFTAGQGAVSTVLCATLNLRPRKNQVNRKPEGFFNNSCHTDNLWAYVISALFDYGHFL